MTAPSAQQQMYLKILEDLLKLPENRECADCGSKAPRWSSTNLGVFVCIRCSGIHRSLGTHISKVKSVSLDKWTQEQIDVMKSMGNARAKEVYEAYVPDGYPRITPASDNFALEQWIRDKYERKKFMRKDGADHVPVSHHKEREHKQREHREERDSERDHRDHPRETVKVAIPQPRVNTTKAPPVTAPAPAPVVAAPPAQDLLNFDEPKPAPIPPSGTSPPGGDVFGDFTSAPTGPSKDKNSIMQLYNTPLAPAGHPGVPGYPGMPYPGMPVVPHMVQPVYPGPNYNINVGVPPMAVPPNYYVAAGRGMGVAPGPGPNYNVNLAPNVGYGGNLPPHYYQPPPAYGAPYGHPPAGVGMGYAPTATPVAGNSMMNGLNNLRM